jgi:hypothetical protein
MPSVRYDRHQLARVVATLSRTAQALESELT